MRTFAMVMKTTAVSLLLFFPTFFHTSLMRAEETDSVQDVEFIPEIEISAAYKGASYESLHPIANTTLHLQAIERMRVRDIKSLSTLVPGLFIPDYGSRMTSSVYIRGLGSRIDQPAVGMYVDGIPLLNKNNFDFDLADIRSIHVLRGPQNTLYGRNTMGGVIDIQTLSPLVYEGTRLSVEYGNGNTMRGRASIYRRTANDRGWSVALNGSHSDGFHTNTADGNDCDWSNTAGASIRYEQQPDNGLHLTHTASMNWVNQGGYPYRQIDPQSGQLAKIDYNDRCAYHRLSFRDGLSLEGQLGASGLSFISGTSYQWLDDGMTMDQDFTRASLFTLQQKQQEHIVNEDFAIRPAPQPGQCWNWLTGLNFWGRHLRMQAPVCFKAEGIRTLILDNANHGLQTAFPDHVLSFDEQEFDIPSNFRLRSYGAALYHHSTLDIGAWTLTAGLRLEHEGQRLDYDSRALVHYLVTPIMSESKPMPTRLEGNEETSFTELTPSLSATFRRNGWTGHASASRGYKAGGFNTQLFSDLVQQAMTRNLQENLGISIDDGSPLHEVITYKPEYAWNYEAGIKYTGSGWSAETVGFYIDCRNQQLTVFPAGHQTGRMMANAGRTESYGIEASARYAGTHLSLHTAYGWTHATFRKYSDGRTDYRGRHIPYAPEHTLMLAADWQQALHGAGEDWILQLHADWQAAGPIYWNDANTISQDFYGLLAASVALRWKNYGLKIWGKNLTDEHYRTFYFISMQRHFLQEGHPLECGIALTAEF